MGFKDKAPTHYNLFARLESIEDRCLPSGRFAGTHRSKREAIGSRPQGLLGRREQRARSEGMTNLFSGASEGPPVLVKAAMDRSVTRFTE